MSKVPNKRYQNRVQEQTERTVLKTCAILKRFTGIELKKNLGISLPTVNTYLEKFQSLGYIKEIGTIGSDLGRKSRLWECILLKKHVIGIEIDTHNVRIALFQLDGKIIALETYSSINLSSFNSLLEQYIRDFFAKNGIDHQKIDRIGISIPGDISSDQKTIRFATNLGIADTSIIPLEEQLSIPIFLENEANAAALGEVFLDESPLNNNMIFLSISRQGIGGGIIINGMLYKGMRYKGGEIGHMSIDLNGKPCSCGNLGCWERYASEEALLELAQSPLKTFFSNNGKSFESSILTYSHYLGRGIRSLLSIFDASKICVGGNITLYWNKIYPYIYQEVFSGNNFYKSTTDVVISAAKYQEIASLYGAAITPYFSLFYENGNSRVENTINNVNTEETEGDGSSNLLENLEKLRSTPLGIQRIKQNLLLSEENIVEWCKNKIKNPSASIIHKGKNWYINIDEINITVNATSFTIITAHKGAKTY